MTGEYATVTLHFISGGIYAECEELDEGKMIAAGDGDAIMDFINEVDTYANPNTTFSLTEKGKEEVERLKQEEDEGDSEDQD